jgi:hypothetical protein
VRDGVDPAARIVVGEGGGDAIGVGDRLRLAARGVADVGDDAGNADQPAGAVIGERVGGRAERIAVGIGAGEQAAAGVIARGGGVGRSGGGRGAFAHASS